MNTPSAVEPVAFLRAVPRLLRCVPRASLVLVPIAGRNALGALRIDLPRDDGDPAEIAATAVGMVCRVAEADAVAVTVYADADFWAERGVPASAALVERVIDRAADCGLVVRGAFLVAADGWGAYGDEDAPHPLSEIDSGAGAVADDQLAGAALPTVGTSQRRRVAEILGELEEGSPLPRRPLPSAHDEAGARATGMDVAELPDVLEDALSWDPSDLHPAETALLAFVFESPMLRDVALTQWSLDAGSGAAALAWQIEWQQARLASAALPDAPDGPLRLAGEGPRPDVRRLRQGLELARQAAASSPRHAQPGAFAAAAWLSWALGNSTHAGEYVSRVQEIDPDHGLASIMSSILAVNHLPCWVFSPEG